MIVYQGNCFGTNFLNILARPRVVASLLTMYFNMWSDQVIQESLERLIVENLDWQKIDLDPETILRVGCKITLANNDANMIANPEAMKRVFARLGRVTNANFIQTWEKLDHVSDTLEVLNGRELKPDESLKYLKQFIDFGCDLASSIRA